MIINVPFLIFKDSGADVGSDMEIASAFLFFDLNKGESNKGIFTKQPKEDILWIARGLYPLKAKPLDDGEKLYCAYDGMGIMNSVIELECGEEIDFKVDFEDTGSKDIRSRVDGIRKAIEDIKARDSLKAESGGLVWGYKNLEGILGGKGEDILYDISVNPEVLMGQAGNDVSLIRGVMSGIRASIEKEIQLIKDLGTLDDGIFKESIAVRNQIYEDFKEKIYQLDRQISGNISRLIIEREDKIREVDKTYSDKIAYLTQDYIYNKNKYDIAKIYGNEMEMDIYQRSMSDAQAKTEEFKKEGDREVGKVEKYYDGLLEEEKKKLKQTIGDRDNMVKENERLYSEFHSAIDELKGIVSEDVFVRRKQLDKINSWFANFQCSDSCETIDIYVPFYIAGYCGEDVRYKLFFPQVLEEKGHFVSLISGIAGKVPQPFGERDEFFQKLYNVLKDYLESEESRDLLGSFSNNNIIAKEGMNELVEKGMKALLESGYLNDKSYEKVLSNIKPMFPDQNFDNGI